jgi:C4-dicarboxylate transporter DctM subunit
VCIWHGAAHRLSTTARTAAPGADLGRHADAGPALLMPVIIIGGIWSGPVHAQRVRRHRRGLRPGRVAVLLPDLKLARIPQLLLNAFVTSATVMLVIGATGAMAWLITVEQVAVQMAAWIQVVATEPWMFLLLFNVCLLLLGIFIEPLPAMLLSAPLFLPLAKHFGMDMVHIGVVMTANLAIALYTPPVGGTLFVAAKLARCRHRRDHAAPVAADGGHLHGRAAGHLHPGAVDLAAAHSPWRPASALSHCPRCRRWMKRG